MTNIFKKKNYKYLISYAFEATQIVSGQGTDKELIEPVQGTGRTVINYDKKIKTQKDLLNAEKYLMDVIDVPQLKSVSIYSFSLLEGEE